MSHNKCCQPGILSPEGIIESVPFPPRPSFFKSKSSSSATNRSNSTSVSSGLGSSISNNNTSSPPSYSRIIPTVGGANRTNNTSVHSNSPKFVNYSATRNEGNLQPGQQQPQPSATRSASVPSGTTGIRHQQRSLPAPPDEKLGKEQPPVSNPSLTTEDKFSRDSSCIPPSFYHNRGEYFKPQN